MAVICVGFLKQTRHQANLEEFWKKVKVFEALSQGKTWVLPRRILEVQAVERGIWKMY